MRFFKQCVAVFSCAGLIGAMSARSAQAELNLAPLAKTDLGPCLAVTTAMEEKNDTNSGLKSLRLAIIDRMAAELHAEGNSTPPQDLIKPMVAQVEAQWNSAQAHAMANSCWAKSETGTQKLLSSPAYVQALQCWSVESIVKPEEPLVTFMEADLRIAMQTARVPSGLFIPFIQGFREEMKAQVAAATPDALKTFDGCIAKTWTPMRALAYDPVPKPVTTAAWDQMGNAQAAFAKMAAEPDAPRAVLEMKDHIALPTWSTTPETWDAWIKGNQISTASAMCAAIHPISGMPKDAAGNLFDVPAFSIFVISASSFYNLSNAGYFDLFAQVGRNLTRDTRPDGLEKACRKWLEDGAKSLHREIYWPQ